MEQGMKNLFGRKGLSNEAMVRMFNVYDKTPKDGFLEKKELHTMFMVRDRANAREAAKIFGDADKNDDNKLSMEEFSKEAIKLVFGEKAAFARNEVPTYFGYEVPV